eukprot:RCo020985
MEVGMVESGNMATGEGPGSGAAEGTARGSTGKEDHPPSGSPGRGKAGVEDKGRKEDPKAAAEPNPSGAPTTGKGLDRRVSIPTGGGQAAPNERVGAVPQLSTMVFIYRWRKWSQDVERGPFSPPPHDQNKELATSASCMKGTIAHT